MRSFRFRQNVNARHRDGIAQQSRPRLQIMRRFQGVFQVLRRPSLISLPYSLDQTLCSRAKAYFQGFRAFRHIHDFSGLCIINQHVKGEYPKRQSSKSKSRMTQTPTAGNRCFTLGVVIVNYRTPALVEACLNSIGPMLAPADAGVVIVDNASGDGSFERISAFCAAAPEAARLKVVAAPANDGFSAGNNIGCAAIDSDFVLFLNSDAAVMPGALDALLAAAAASPDAGIFAPRIVGSDGVAQVSRFRRHSPLGEFVDGAQTGPLTRLLSNAEVPIFPDDTSTPDWVSFAAVMIRRSALDKAGPMDDGFFLYYEDCDYCRSIVQQGFAIACVDDAVFVHDAGGSTKIREMSEQHARLPEYYYRARSYYFKKYYGPAGPLMANLAWCAGRGLALLRGLFGRAAPRLNDHRGRDIWIGWR